MQSHVVHDLVVVPNRSDSAAGAAAVAAASRFARPGELFGGIAAPSAEYELRLLDARDKAIKTLRFRRPGDDSARRFILGVREDFERYELWRGMEKIDAGGRLIIR